MQRLLGVPVNPGVLDARIVVADVLRCADFVRIGDIFCKCALEFGFLKQKAKTVPPEPCTGDTALYDDPSQRLKR